jgi:hypothetical protein
VQEIQFDFVLHCFAMGWIELHGDLKKIDSVGMIYTVFMSSGAWVGHELKAELMRITLVTGKFV